MYKDTSLDCHNIFDGRGGVLDHAFHPYPHHLHVQINIDFKVKWYYKYDSASSSN